MLARVGGIGGGTRLDRGVAGKQGEEAKREEAESGGGKQHGGDGRPFTGGLADPTPEQREKARSVCFLSGGAL